MYRRIIVHVKSEKYVARKSNGISTPPSVYKYITNENELCLYYSNHFTLLILFKIIIMIVCVCVFAVVLCV